MRLLFVCLGNICRSPAAEAVMNNLIKVRGFSDRIICDSAGTSGYHQGELADKRMRECAIKRGVEILSRSRKFLKKDFLDFDYIFVMDDQNMRDVLLQDTDKEFLNKIFKITDFCTKIKIDHVPDPYYGGSEGFDFVLDILEDACGNLLKKIEKEV